MYTEEIIKLATLSTDKSSMIKLSLNKVDRPKIESATDWMDSFYKKLPLKVRCVAILAGYTEETFPKCPNCDLPVGYDKEYQSSFNKFCSDKCSKEHGRLSEYAKKCLTDYDWLYNKRVILGMSHDLIGKELGCSEFPVIQSCKHLDIKSLKL